jgi:hypothetical protein
MKNEMLYLVYLVSIERKFHQNQPLYHMILLVAEHVLETTCEKRKNAVFAAEQGDRGSGLQLILGPLLGFS